MPKTKRVDPIKQREKRAKIAAAIGGLLFLVIAAVEIPPVLKSGGGAPPAASSPSTTTAAAPAVTTPSGATSSSGLADTDVPPAAEAGQLVSFNVFESKNPFKPQVTATTSPAATTAPASQPTNAEKHGADVPSQGTTTTTPTTTSPTGVVPQAPGTTTPTTTTAAPPPTVAIRVNGAVSRVAAQGTFPSGSPVFRLVSYDSGSAQVGIVGGSYAAGGETLTLQLDHPVTLENQTDGKQYRLELVSVP